MTSKPADDKPIAAIATYYVLAMGHSPPVVVFSTHDRKEADEIRDRYAAQNEGDVIVTTDKR